MLFHVFETYGWETWNFFFRIAKQSRIPQPSCINMEDLAKKDASLTFSMFVYLLSLAAGEDLRPQFKTWRFRIEPEVESFRVYRFSFLILHSSSSSVKVGDVLDVTVDLTDLEGNPLGNQTVTFYIEPVDGSRRSIGSATTDSSGHAVIIFRVDFDAGEYEVVALYAGSVTYGQRTVSIPLTVEGVLITSTTIAPPVTSATEVTAQSSALHEQTWLQTDWSHLIAAVLVVVALAVVVLSRKSMRKGGQ
jgi:hypothetical protein